MLRLCRTANGQVVFKVAGSMGTEEIGILRGKLLGEPAGNRVVLDLSDLRLVNRDAVRFLAECERMGISLLHAASYIRLWIEREGTLARTNGNL